MSKRARIYIAITLLAVMASFQNCANTNFGASGDPSRVGFGEGEFDGNYGEVLALCNRNSFQTVTKKLKIILVVDNSGSTLQTDPQKFRQASVDDLITKYAAKANFSWQLILFNGSTARALINNGNTNSPIFSDVAGARTALNVFSAERAAGETPYLAALSRAEDAIRLDPELNGPEAPLYVVMFMSDGQPTDSNTSQILAAETNLLNRAAGRISLNSLYFGSDNSTQAMDRLKQMSDLGKGQFTNITSGKAFVRIDDISIIPQSGCAPPATP